MYVGDASRLEPFVAIISQRTRCTLSADAESEA